jgi:hypothetical protein
VVRQAHHDSPTIVILTSDSQDFTTRNDKEELPKFLQISSQLLLSFNGFKQCLEIAGTKGFCPFALNDLEEQSGPVFNRFGEDLQQVAFIIPVNQNA